ncbi:MAG TPA: pantoate--beta-alanine ligase, partial [Arenibaculum sp.]|nr:pantoate--beta-alanine ligase [Arenibaculum sp.]
MSANAADGPHMALPEDAAPASGGSPALPVARTIADLRIRVAAWRAAGETIGLVPTMGALHAGHVSLIERARAECRRVVASIFVNPTQFGPSEDFTRYPRDETADGTKLAAAGADLMFAPGVDEVYPQGFATAVTVEGLTRGLCGPLRPGHFAGVATVVTKLLLQCLPDVAVFGEKDFQQLQVVRRTVRDLDIPVRIVGAPTVRDAYGLALSSRNAYLSAEQLATARQLNRVLFEVADHLRRAPGDIAEALAQGRRRRPGAGFDELDYLAVCGIAALQPLGTVARPARVLAAAWLGRTRL